MAGKLKVLIINDLKSWNEDVFENLDSKRNCLLDQLRCLVEREFVGDFSGEDLERKKWLVAELELISLMEEIYWRQNSRVLWLNEGGKYTKFFHQIMNSHRRNITILRSYMMEIAFF